MDITYGNKTFKNEKSSGEVILQLFGTCFFHKIILQVLIYIEISLVNLLQIALPITGYNRLLDKLKIEKNVKIVVCLEQYKILD